MKRTFLYIVLLLVATILSWVVLRFYEAYQPKPIILQGEIDAQTYSISSKLPARVSKIYVKKGDMVKRGDIIFTLSSPEVEAKMAQAKAANAVAKAQKKEADRGAREQEIQAAIDQAKKANVAKELMKRAVNIFKEMK
jgi:HlyD family secretion protein